MDTKDLSKQILVNIGGSENVNNVTHCATRLRITVKDEAQINKDKIDGLDGTLGSVNSGGQFQIIIGQNVGRVYEAFSAELEGAGDKVEKEEVVEASSDKKKSVFSNILDTITGIFTPLLPAITAAAMIKTLLVLLDLFHLIDPTGGTYKVLMFAGDTAFYFMPVLVAFSASLKFKLNPYLGALMGLLLIHPSFVTLVADKNPINLFVFLPVTLANYSSTVIPIMLIIWIASYVDRYADKFCPEAVKFFIRPLVTFFVMIPLALVVIGPLGYLVGQGLESVIDTIQVHAIWVLPLIFGALSPIFIMTGMHYAITIPLVLQSISSNGFDMLGIGFLVANIAQGGAAFAVGRYAKATQVKSLAYSSGFTALLGITEPALYGVNLKYKKPFLAVMIAGGISGLLAGILSVKRMTFAPTGLTTLPIFIDPANPWNLVFAILASILSFILAFILTSAFIYKDNRLQKELGGE
ncbi:PTS sugar transporter [Listeria ivanovii]|uniref:PTS transporter subunit EIIC n=1 Tax=Listeria ivanovii TaxID=1638 RepID=UPI000DA9C46E|nr:PTS transporter subunit EIIC [Listeria ivanovii]PZF87859.1 PTS sugar transporter [Listeria ivanovii]PZF93059.1 PTS sugar transporter [Listeria ivanovii]PZG03937.1 PTS sugar transporter [Listeria ivanovii]PZG08344.1 PTS sugar transporter [Listeria ivanovii]PZG25175.1 PTS sugar transporter [Listeria ivanovii]